MSKGFFTQRAPAFPGTGSQGLGLDRRWLAWSRDRWHRAVKMAASNMTPISVPLSPELSAIIAKLLADFISTADERAAALASRVSALPLLQDMGGFYGLRPSGELVEVLWDEPESLRQIADQRIANMALYRGSRTFPQLAELAPQRTDAAVPCNSCGGSGLVSVPTHLQDRVLCWCGGLGWLPSMDYELRPVQPIEAIRKWWQFRRRT
jgi:hypothetical protein